MRLKLGILADEFFDRTIGRMGGFGWAARQVANFFNAQPELGVDVVFLAASLKGHRGLTYSYVHGTKLVFRFGEPMYRQTIFAEKLDLILAIDFRPQYREVLKLLPHVPVIIWVRDPKPPEILARQATLRIPDQKTFKPRGIKPIDCSSLSLLVDPHRNSGRRFLFGTPAHSLGLHIQSTYRISDVNCSFLPNIVDINAGQVTKSEYPRVIFLGRLDPIKRPWLFVELARQFPSMEFFMLGQKHFQGQGAWIPRRLPENVRLVGHIDGSRKIRLLSSAWVLINTSIHEALATSFLEAVACEVPILSSTNQESVASRFGIFVGLWEGDGMDSLPHFASALYELLEDPILRYRLGREGRDWVEKTHNGTNFLTAFDALCSEVGLCRISHMSTAS